MRRSSVHDRADTLADVPKPIYDKFAIESAAPVDRPAVWAALQSLMAETDETLTPLAVEAPWRRVDAVPADASRFGVETLELSMVLRDDGPASYVAMSAVYGPLAEAGANPEIGEWARTVLEARMAELSRRLRPE